MEKNEGLFAENSGLADPPLCELDAHSWAVVSFDTVEARNLTFAEALKRLEELEMRHVAGLCLVTDDAASRLTS